MAQAQRHHQLIHEARRSVSRLRVNLPARIILLDRTIPCVLENVSQLGARLMVEKPPKLGEFGIMQCEMLDCYFDIVWQSGRRIGVAFDQPIEQSVLIALREFNDTFSERQRNEIKALARSWVTGELD